MVSNVRLIPHASYSFGGRVLTAVIGLFATALFAIPIGKNNRPFMRA
eukprot:COSAG05_NODE_500_length_9234_cov_107.281664_12_plen_47_part_00